MVLELASRLEGGQGVGLTLDVVIFVFTGHFFCLVFVFLFIFFPFGLFPFIPTADPLQLRESFAITYISSTRRDWSPGSIFRCPPPHVF